jgi:hypothetical protein
MRLREGLPERILVRLVGQGSVGNVDDHTDLRSQVIVDYPIAGLSELQHQEADALQRLSIEAD